MVKGSTDWELWDLKSKTSGGHHDGNIAIADMV